MGGGCGGSMEGGEEVAAPRRGTWPDGGKVTARYSFSPSSIKESKKDQRGLPESARELGGQRCGDNPSCSRYKTERQTGLSYLITRRPELTCTRCSLLLTC